MIIMKNHSIKNKKGMTLVEVILSIALVGIIASMTVIVFSSGIMMALRSGDNTEVTGNSSGILENALGGADVTEGPGDELRVLGVTIGEGEYTEDDAANATVRFSGIDTEIISGNYVTVYTESDQNNTTMAAFIPDAD